MTERWSLTYDEARGVGDFIATSPEAPRVIVNMPRDERRVRARQLVRRFNEGRSEMKTTRGGEVPTE